MTLTKLAKMANTSVATVSKAFSGSKEISDKTRERIFKIAKELDCFDKYYKATRSRPMIALMPPEPESPYYGEAMGIIEREFNRRGADTIIAFTRFDAEREARIFRELAYGLKVDGIVLWGEGKLIKNPDEIPLVVIVGGKLSSRSTNGKHLSQNADIVDIDTDSAIFRMIETIKSYGHTEVGFIGEGLTKSTEQKFRKAMRRAGLPIYSKYIATSSKRFAEAGEECMKELLSRGSVPSVIVAAYDQIAYGAMNYARGAGYKIPDDISFVGTHEISVIPYTDIPLSSLYIDINSACSHIINLIFNRIENRHYRAREEISIPVSVHLRESLKRIK